MVTLGRGEIRRRFRALRGFRRRYALGIRVVAAALREDDPVLGAVAEFLSARRDLLSAGEIRRLAPAAVGDEPGRELAALRERLESAGGRLVPGSYRRADRLTAEAIGDHGEEGLLVWRRLRYPAAEIRRRLAWTRPLWRALALADAAVLRQEFEDWAERRTDWEAVSRDLVDLPWTTIPVESPVLLSRGDARCRVYRDVGRRDDGEERCLAAWMAMALEGRRIFEDPGPASWWERDGGRVVAVDGPIVSITAGEAARLDRYLAATLLERREVAAEALLDLLEKRPRPEAGRRLQAELRQAVPERDRLDGDWSDRPVSNLLAHWRLVSEAGLRPRRALVAFWRGLAVWDRRLGDSMDLAGAFQRWQAARLADRIVSDAGSNLVGPLAEGLADRLDGPLGDAGGSGPGPGGERSRTGLGAAAFLGAGLLLAWLQPGDLAAFGLLGLMALGVGWALRR